MSTPKYKITPGMLERRGEIAKLERDGHTRESIHKAMYNITDGARVEERRKIISELYERK
jgi:hypothetical protein